jgi:hypothetical protein
MFERHLSICIGHPNRDDVLMEVRNHLMLAFYMMKAPRHKMQYHKGCYGYLVTEDDIKLIDRKGRSSLTSYT